jgi:ABC-type multidrug transport system fused ATPase/permease subunit
MTPKRGPVAGSVWRCLRPYRGRITAALALLVLSAVIEVVEPLPLKVLIDDVLKKKTPPWLEGGTPADLLLATCAAILVLALLGGFAGYVATTRIAMIAQDATFDLRNEVFQHISSLALADHAGRRSGELVHRLTSDIAAIQELIFSLLTSLFVNGLTIIGVLTVMAVMDPFLTLATVAGSLPLYFLTRRFARQIKTSTRAVRTAEGELAATVQEVLSAIRIVKCFGREAHEAERFRSRSRASLEASRTMARVLHRMRPIAELLAAIGTVMIVYVGARRVLAHDLSVGGIVVFLAYQKALYSPIRQLAKLAGVIAKGSVSIDRIEKLLIPGMEQAPLQEQHAIGPVRGEVEFENVDFVYGARSGGVRDPTPVLSGVSFGIPSGSRVALVGSSGAGKTTLVSLILRLYDATSGVVRIDGNDVRKLDARSLRSQIGLVLQEPVLFRATIWENIAYGFSDVPSGYGPDWLAGQCSEDRARFMRTIEQAARSANAHEFIERLPLAYDTIIGERGDELSGGQRQRIAIARAIIRNAPIQILDEPATGLDAESETLVMDALERLTKGRTTFVIAHRLSTVRKADLILVLEGGRIVESGTHPELRIKGGRYQELCDLELASSVGVAV